jgi:endoglucanase
VAIGQGLEVIVNAHGDAYLWADVTAAGANYTYIEEKFYAMWYQVGKALACKPSQLAFEPINEPAASNQQHYDEINKLNQIFVQALSDAGGFNKDRVVTLVGPQVGSVTILKILQTC